MSALMQELVGHEAVVWLFEGLGQPGTILDVSKRWLHLTSSTLGTLLIPVESTRLIKVPGGMTARCTEGDLSPKLVGRTVTVTSGSEPKYTDFGELEAFDENWLRVRVKSAQLYFSVSCILEMRML